MVSPSSGRITRAPPYSRVISFFHLRDYHPLRSRFPSCSSYFTHNPSADPISLATTFGVSVDFLSCRYLDVSVPCVRFLTLCIHARIPPTRWVAPFGYPRIKDRSHLPAAFRKVLRPSSPLSAKASTKCSCLLVHSIRIYYSHSIHSSNTIIPRTPFPVQANHGFFRISIKLFSRLPGANARCFISAYVTFR